jgi:predicted RNA-binding Zn-ribbon protein involved in translation (DUF1610 family)
MDALHRFAPAFLDQVSSSPSTRSILGLLLRCRTPALGGHRYACEDCGFTADHYNSCGSRYCPQCQGRRRQRWLEAQQALLLPVPHFQVVFTLPSELRGIAKAWPREIYDLLFQAAQQTLQTLAQRQWNAKLAILAVLHTWTRELKDHPHVHCVVSGGGLTEDGAWVSSEREFLFPISTMRGLFRALFLAGLEDLRLPLNRRQRHKLRAARRHRDWVVFVEAPEDRDPANLVKYLARYVYQTAISNSRIVSIGDATVTFRTRGDAVVTLPGVEFVRRFTQHFLPKGIRKIRHYGLLAPGARAQLALARDLTARSSSDDQPERLRESLPDTTPLEEASARCPDCGSPLRYRLLKPRVRTWAPTPPTSARGPP